MAGIRGSGHRTSEDIGSQKSPLCADPGLLACASFLPEHHFSDPIPGAKQSSSTKLQPPKAIYILGGWQNKRALSHIIFKEHGLACGEKRSGEESLFQHCLLSWSDLSLQAEFVFLCWGWGVRNAMMGVSLWDWHKVALVFWEGTHFQPWPLRIFQVLLHSE